MNKLKGLEFYKIMLYPLRFNVYLPILVACLFVTVMAQDGVETVANRSSCSRDSMLAVIQRQVDLSKTIDNDGKRIALLLRAADLTWTFEQDKARATFSDAFEIATRAFREKGGQGTLKERFREGTDYRYKVITAIAKHDPAWARKLSKQILDEETQEAKDKAQKDPDQAKQTADKLLRAATSLLASDQPTALSFARSSLHYPATLSLPSFLFELWKVNGNLADQFYLEALNAYGQAPMDQFLYLSSYPFAAPRELGEMPEWTSYRLPAGIRANPALERLFVSALIGRAREFIANPATAKTGSRLSDTGQMFIALSRLEPLVANSLPALSAVVAQAKESIGPLLTQSELTHTTNSLTDPAKRSFDEIIESANRIPDAAQRDVKIAMAIITGSNTESPETLETAAEKLNDVTLRRRIVGFTYFYSALKSIKEKKIDEARRFALKIEELDQRADLYAQIAAELLKQKTADTEIREILEEVVEAINKAPNSEVKVRAMLVSVHLYSSVDSNRSMALLSEAVTAINHLDETELLGDLIVIPVESKQSGVIAYRTVQTPGFSPEVVFAEMGKLDFDGTLYLATNLSDKSVRGMTSLALAGQCLKDLPAPPSLDQTKPRKPRPRL